MVFTSDHGYKQGQWRIGTSKQHPYETDIRVPFIIRGPGIPRGANHTRQLAGNIDLLPTLLELAAGAEYVAAVAPDGRSMASFLLPTHARTRSVADRPWRDAFLNEYLSVGTYWNDHSTCWANGSQTLDECGGPMPRGPGPNQPSTCHEASGVGTGNCYFVDSTHSNSWRQLRVLNATHNLNYIEYDSQWLFDATGPTGAGLQHYELYDVASDPYQMHNLYLSTTNSTRAALHTQLATFYACRGVTCP